MTASTVFDQMNTIQNNLNDAWNSCPDNPPCQSKIASIPDYQQLYDSYSASFSGKAAADFSSWRIEVSLAEGDMKQWSINVSFGKPVQTSLVTLIGNEVQGAQGDITSFHQDY